MNRITLVADIAGRPTRDIAGSPRVTAGALVLPTANLQTIREAIPSDLPKWKSIDSDAAAQVVELIQRHSVAVAASTVNRDTDAWRKALEDEKILQAAIVDQSRKPAGWVKLPVLLVYELLGRACYRGLSYFLREYKGHRIFSSSGLAPIECNVICDQEVSGDENVDVFMSFWGAEQVPAKNLAQFGYSVDHPQVTLQSDSDEPLLKLADIAAGLVHSAHISSPGRVNMPIDCQTSRELLKPLIANQLLSIDAFNYDGSYDEVFGYVMQAARQARDG